MVLVFRRPVDAEIGQSSSYFPQSNGGAECAVRKVKYLALKTDLDEDAMARGLLELRNTPVKGMAPSERVFGRVMRTLIPSLNLGRRSGEEFEMAAEKLSRLEEQRERAFNKTARLRDASDITAGSKVRVRDHVTGRWDTSGEVIEVLPHQQLKVKLQEGLVSIRNRSHIRLDVAGTGPQDTGGARPQDDEEAGPGDPRPRRSTRERRRPQRLGTAA